MTTSTSPNTVIEHKPDTPTNPVLCAAVDVAISFALSLCAPGIKRSPSKRPAPAINIHASADELRKQFESVPTARPGVDRKRSASLNMIADVSPRERADAVARMEENTLIVQWVQQALERRISSYRWALERLVIQAPDGMAADAERQINELARLTANAPLVSGPVTGQAVVTKG